MQNMKDLEYEIEQIKYDLESKEMKRKGYRISFKNLIEHLMVSTCILFFILLFFCITIWGNYNNVFSYAFTVVLKPFLYIPAILYIVFFIIKPIWKIYINSTLKSARRLALKQRVNSISAKIESCDEEIAQLNTKLIKFEDALRDEELNSKRE